MVFVQKDIYPKIIDNYIKAQNNATKIQHYNPLDNVKPMKPTTNLILDQRTASLKNSPIMNSDKKTAPIIPSYQKFKGATILPTYKEDLKHWRLVYN
jgi:hypothetical protein